MTTMSSSPSLVPPIEPSQSSSKGEPSSFVADFEAFAIQRADGEPAGVQALRRNALERFATLGFPSKDNEEWRFTNIGPITRTEFHRDFETGEALGEADVEPWAFARSAARLVFVDGRFSADLSKYGTLPEGAIVGSLAEALHANPDLVTEHLGRHARFEEHAFVALNTAYMEDGAFVWLPPHAVVEDPIHLLFLSTGSSDDEARPRVAFQRNLFVIGENVQATVVETFGGPEGSCYFNCPVTELVVGPGAVVDHYKMQQESTGAFHLATFQLYQERSSNYSLHSISLGGALVRNDVNARLDGEGCETTLNGLYMVRGTQSVDHHMLVEHAMPNCNSYELFKGILEDSSRAVFSGLIHVFEDAQKTDAKQSNKNLLLSDKALVNSLPQLRIFADDVKCTHGSTVGELDDDAIFYLRSRGIGAEAARSLLTYAFASDVVERVKVPELRQDLEEFLFHRLPKGEVVRQAI